MADKNEEQQLKPKYEKWKQQTDKMDAKGDIQNIKKTYEQIPCSFKTLNENYLLTTSKEQLIQLILKHKDKLLVDEKKHRKNYIKKPKKQLDFDEQPQVRIALKFAYLGMDYKGLAVQANVDETIENRIFEALRKIFLVDPEGAMYKCRYARCGRTDKGVSALGNVCSLFVRKLKGNDYTQRIN